MDDHSHMTTKIEVLAYGPKIIRERAQLPLSLTMGNDTYRYEIQLSDAEFKIIRIQNDDECGREETIFIDNDLKMWKSIQVDTS